MAVIEDRLRAEQAVLGAMLIDADCIPALLSKVDPADFTVEQDRIIFQTIRTLFRSGIPADPITVRDKLGREHTDYLVQLCDLTPTSANAEVYARIMHEQAALERIKDACQQVQDLTTLDEARPIIAQLTQSLDRGKHIDMWTMRDVLEYFQRSQTEEKQRREYISVGIKELDEGSFLQRGDVAVIAGEPSAGKTAFGLSVAMTMAKSYKVGFFSLETKNEKLADRLITEKMDIDFTAIKRGKLTEEDWTKFAKGSTDFLAGDLTLIPCSGMTATEICSITTACGFDVIFIDYAQLLRPEIPDKLGSTAQMADVSRNLHTFAQKSNVLLVELLQLSRSEKKGGWREPDMHDLKETGQWEQDADMIFLLYLPNPKSEYSADTTRIIKIAKNKEGRRGSWYLHFDGSHQRFTVMTDNGGRALMSQLKSKGDLARQKSRISSMRDQITFQEIEDDGDMPL